MPMRDENNAWIMAAYKEVEAAKLSVHAAMACHVLIACEMYERETGERLDYRGVIAAEKSGRKVL